MEKPLAVQAGARARGTMKQRRSDIRQCGGRFSAPFLALLLISGGSVMPGGRPALAATTTTLSADATVQGFIDSLGINVHWNYGDTAYGSRYTEVRDRLIELGIRHVRDFANPRISELAQIGIRTTLLTDPRTASPRDVKELVARLNQERPSIAAVEGANEPDLFWGPLGISYRGAGYPEGPVLWQQDLYTALKDDARTAAVPVIGPSLGTATSMDRPSVAAWAGLGRYADFGNFHPYAFNGNPFAPIVAYAGLDNYAFQGNHPSVLVGASDGGRTAYADIYPDMPMMATEVGYPTGPNRTSEALQAKYVTRSFLENFRAGVVRSYLYELLDAVAPTVEENPHAGFGLLRSDATPRPAFHAVRRMVAALKDEAAATRRCDGGQALELTVEGTHAFPDTSRLHGLALRQPQGALTVLLWHEVSGELARTRPRQNLSVDALTVRLRAGCRIQAGPIDITSGATVPASLSEGGRVLNLLVDDSPVAIQIGE